jgi:NAD(P)-dependent dehydrogenase (short-subunit alcohol dehydrogenase family)
MYPLDGSNAVLVTGSSSGIGRDAVLHLNGLGYRVFANVRRAEDAASLASAARYPERLHPLVFDVTSAPGVAAAVETLSATLDQRGRLIGLFSNAGMGAYDGDLSCEGCSLDTQRQLMEVNFFGAVRVIQAFLPTLRASHGTVIVNSAMIAHAVIPFNAGYAASKCALEGWVDAMRREVQPLGVRVSLIQAAEIQTEFLAKAKPEGIPTDSPYKAQYALGQMFFAKPRPSTPPRAAAPRRVSELVARILQQDRPRPRYHVGRGAKPLYLLGLLPDRVQDKAFGKLVGMALRGGQPDT